MCCAGMFVTRASRSVCRASCRAGMLVLVTRVEQCVVLRVVQCVLLECSLRESCTGADPGFLEAGVQGRQTNSCDVICDVIAPGGASYEIATTALCVTLLSVILYSVSSSRDSYSGRFQGWSLTRIRARVQIEHARTQNGDSLAYTHTHSQDGDSLARTN